MGADASIIDSVIFGNVQQSTTDCSYLARHVGLNAGVPIETPALTVNRLCGSSFQSVINAVQEIRCGDASVVLTGGAESMSSSPYTLPASMRWGSPLGVDPVLTDSLWQGLTDLNCNQPKGLPMAMTAENLAERQGVNKADADKIAAQSQARWAVAQAAGVFKDEIEPMEVNLGRKKGVVSFEVDEHPRPSSDFAALQGLKAIFKKDGVVSAGNASGISDGASAVIVASAEAVEKYNLKPMAKIEAYAVSGVEPEVMGRGPVPAFEAVMAKTGLKMDDFDRVEINEAFAAQVAAVNKELGYDSFDERFNTHGGAIAIGHPTGASGGRIVGHLAHELARNPDMKYVAGGACIGGGQGIAIVLSQV